MHVVFRSLLKIFGYATKQACKQLQCIKAKLLEPASIKGLHNIRVYARASLLKAYTNENRNRHIYTVTNVNIGQSYHTDVDLGLLLMRTQPNKLSLMHVYLETVGEHPGTQVYIRLVHQYTQ